MTFRELGTLCLAPVVMVGYLTAFEMNSSVSHKTRETTGSGTLFQVQSCERGLGFDVKASTNGLYGLDAQYGFQWLPTESLSATFTPRLGVSYVDHPVKELPQRTQFGLGAALTLGYERYRVGVEYWHLSNGSALGLNVSNEPNIGLNLIAITGGWSF